MGYLIANKLGVVITKVRGVLYMELAISFNPLTSYAFPNASSIAHAPHDQLRVIVDQINLFL